MKKIFFVFAFLFWVFLGQSLGFGQDSLVIQIHPLPVKVILASTEDSILVGHSSSISASNCVSPNTLVWYSTTTSNANPIVVTPNLDTYYKAYCKTPFNCVGPADSILVRVKSPNPPVFDGQEGGTDSVAICQTDSVSLSINETLCPSTMSVIWSNGAVTPSIKLLGSVIGVGIHSYTYRCRQGTLLSANSGNVKVNVLTNPPTPVLIASPAIITTTQSAVLSASGCLGTVVWSGSLGSGSPITVSPVITTTYTAKCVSSFGCESPLASVLVTVNAPKPDVTSNVTEACNGSSFTLTASLCVGASSGYVWSTGAVTPSFIVTSAMYAAQTMYWVECRNGSGTSARRYIKVKFD